MREEDSWLTAFSTCFGQFGWRVCPQGLASSPAVAQRLFSGILQSLPNVNADFQPGGTTEPPNRTRGCVLRRRPHSRRPFEEHLSFLWSFLYAMEEQKLHLSALKTQFIKDRCNYLGHVLSSDGVAVQPERVTALRAWPAPTNTTEVRAFLGFAVYLRRHIEGFGTYAAPLSVLTGKGAVFTWGPAEQKAFEALRDVCCSPRVLATPRPGLLYQLRCDVSDFAASHSLWQLHTLPDTTTVWRPIEFRSMSFNTSERSRAAHARELLSFIGGLKYFRPFLSGVPFSVITDASALA